MNSNTNSMRIGIIMGNRIKSFHRRVIEKIVSEPSISIDLIIIDVGKELSLKQIIYKNIKRGRGGYMIIMALRKFLANNKQKTGESNPKVFCNNILETDNPYSKDFCTKISEHNLDTLVLLDGFGIIKEPFLGACKGGILSYHHGDMRKYRGMPPCFWELYNGEKSMGITVQKITKGLDCGSPIIEKEVIIKDNDNLSTLTERAYIESEDMMAKALIKLHSKKFKPISIKKLGLVYTLPNLRQWLRLRSKLLYRRFF